MGTQHKKRDGQNKSSEDFHLDPPETFGMKMNERILWEQRGKSGRTHSANIWKEREKTGSKQMCNRTRVARVSGVDVSVLQTLWSPMGSNTN